MKRGRQVFRAGMILILIWSFSFLASCGGGDDSHSISVPSAPSVFNAAPGESAATVTWNAVEGATTYNLYIATQEGVTKANYLSKNGGRKQAGVTSPFILTGLNNFTTYHMVVTAENEAGESGESPAIRITPAPPAPANDIAAGGTHTVALKTNGMVWTWGRNETGQLGDGTTTRRLTPIQVNGLIGISDVAAGLDHTLALKQEDGSVWAWGRNHFGQLGDGTTTNGLYPVQVTGLAGMTALAGGRNHSLALKNDGTVWAWGDNSSGQLGNNSAISSLTPVRVNGFVSVPPGSPPGTPVVTAIAAGAFHSVALKSDGTVWIWGDNRHAQINNQGQNALEPVLMTGFTGQIVLAIAAGDFHTVAYRNNDTVMTWGSNGSGQLGLGTFTDQPIPTTVPGLAAVANIGAGGSHTLVIKRDKTVTAWGDHIFGREIDGVTIKHPSPVPINGLTAVKQVAGGGLHAVALKEEGSVWTWGDNFTGQLGNGTTADHFTPTQVLGPLS